MIDKMGYVIKDEKGNYVSPRSFTKTNQGWLYISYTGDTTGFTFYTNKKTAEEDLKVLQNLNDKYGFGKNFSLEYINLKTIKKGKCNYRQCIFNNV